MQPIEILVAGPYNAFYAAGFAVAFGVAAWYGWRAGWAPVPWFALLAGCVAGGIAGSKLLFFDLHAHAPGEKTVLGGMAGGLLALLVLQRFLGVRASAARVLAPAALLGYGLGRIGCFLAGCCFGTPTSLPWGVRYATGTPPFEAQSAGGLLEAAADVSHAVHPTQLYEAALAVLLAAALARWGARCRSAGGVAIALIIAVALIRLGVQPFRHVAAAHLILGLQPVQWAMLLASATAAITLAIRERAARDAGTAAELLPQRVPALRGALVVSGILGLIFFLGGWLTPLERVVLASAVVPSGLLLLSRLLARATPVLAAGTLVLVPVIGDTIPTRTWLTVGAGGMAGRYESELDLSPGDDCGPSEIRAHSYRVLGISAGYARRDAPRRGHAIRGRLFGGTNRIEWAHGERIDDDVSLMGVSLAGSIDFPLSGFLARELWLGEGSWVGLTGGFVTGRMMSESGVPGTRIEPVAGLRLGWESFFFDTQYNDHDPAPNPNTRVKVSLGYEWEEAGSNVRVGAWESGGIFLGGQLVTRGGLEIEPFIGVLTDDYTSQYGLAVRHRLGSRTGRP